MLPLKALFSIYFNYIVEFSDYLLIGFKPGTVSFIVKEIWNTTPLTLKQAEELYAELTKVGKRAGCRHFRIVAHGGYLPEALAFELYGLTVSDESYLARLASGRHIELFPHNEAAYRTLEIAFRTHRIGAVVQATGTGKSFLIARYILSHPEERLLVIAPNTTILDEIRRAVAQKIGSVAYYTFQSLVHLRKKFLGKGNPRRIVAEETRLGKEIISGKLFFCARETSLDKIQKPAEENKWPLVADHILIDEFHHFGAEVWGQAVQEVIEANPKARVLGTSATPIRPEGMVDTVDLYFEGNLFYELSLPAAWHYGILPVPLLVQSVYGLDGKLDRLQRALDRSACSAVRRDRIQRKLDAARMDFKTSLGAAQLIRQFLPASVRKLLVFCRDKEDLKTMKVEVMKWLEEAGWKALSFEIHNGKGERANEQTLKTFRRVETDGRLHVLFSINMLIEGLHVEGVDAALFLRRTESYVVTLQQLGRCLKAGSGQRPVILDFVNNLSGRSVYDVMACDRERATWVRAPKGFESGPEFQVSGFFSDIQRRVKEILAELEPWQIMWERLSEYHEKEQDWPAATEGKLGLWCHTQRLSRKRGTLSKERIRRLDEIGFDWEPQDSRWMRNYHELTAFYRDNSRWPKRGEGMLSVWCNTQRQARKNGQLTKDRIRRLDAIGFVWEYDPEEEWHKNYETVKAFYVEKKRWPKVKDGALGSWCCTQRKFRRQGALSEERTNALAAIGFPWSTDDTWHEKYRRLQLFREINARWPASREGVLGNWCCVQRRLYRQGKLSDERRKNLEKIGFDW